MKKLISLALTFCMVLSSVFCVFSEETEGYKKALVTVKERIGNTDEYDNFTGHVNTGEHGTSYMFSWSSDKSGMDVTITEDGVITDYYTYSSSDDTDTAISERISLTDAGIRAKELLGKINPDIIKNLEFVDGRSTSRGFRFDVIRCENGIWVEGNNGYLSIDSKGERILSFNISYDARAKFESGEIISAEKAAASFNEKLGFELQYVSRYEDDERKVTPVYKIKENFNKYISAVTGEVITVNGSAYDDYKFMAQSTNEAAMDMSSGGFSQAELSELDRVATTISEKDALKIIKSCKYLNLPSKAYEKYNLSTYDIDDKTRGLSFSFNWDECYARAVVNGETGEITSFWKKSETENVKYTKEQAEKTAKDVFASLAGKKTGEYKFDENYAASVIPYSSGNENKTAEFSFDRYVNNIPFYEDSVKIVIDLGDNSVISYNIDYSNVEFSSLDGIVNYETAAAEYIDKSGFIPAYVPDTDEYRLVYKFKDVYGEIDAATGKYDGEEETDKYTDVSGHYAETIVKSLLEYGIGFAGGELKPDEPIQQKEFAALLKNCVSYNGRIILNEDYDYEWLYKHDISDIIENQTEQHPESNVTRLNAAKFTVCAMGMGDIGKLDIFRPMFNDMTDAGYASILSGLKIMNGDGKGNFNPDGILTRAQALIIIYNYLDR